MQLPKKSLQWLSISALAALALISFVGCRSSQCCSQSSEATAASAAASPAAPAAPAATAAAPAAPAVATAPVKAPEPKPVLPTIRIKAGSAGFTDSNGNAWLPDQGFVGGDVIERPELAIANTKDLTIYRAERYSMQSFSQTLPNGKYTVKLHFAETFEGITAAGERVFSFNVEGQDFKDFDVFVKAGGVQKAYVESVDVDITDGKLDITFTANIENPEINGIEIIPKS